jgi:predicted nucleic acid-binding Zn ribbon protein
VLVSAGHPPLCLKVLQQPRILEKLGNRLLSIHDRLLGELRVCGCKKQISQFDSSEKCLRIIEKMKKRTVAEQIQISGIVVVTVDEVLSIVFQRIK